MADKAHVRIVMAGADSIEDWRAENPNVRLDLSGADLSRGKLESVNLCFADCRGADMSKADLRWADLVEADLSDANLTRADLFKSDLSNAKLCRVQLKMANFEDADLSGVDLTDAVFADTRMLNTDFTGAKGLETCRHPRTSNIDQETIGHCGDLPVDFLKGCGLSTREVNAAAMKLASKAIFSDLLFEASNLLSQGNKDAAAVHIGIVLERHLRQLCDTHGIDLFFLNKNGESIHKTSSALNNDLKKEEIINKLDWKIIGAWIDIRNSAAHGHVEEYNIEQVENMYNGVVEFLARVKA